MSSGRTTEQGAQLYYKEGAKYSIETSYCFLHPMDAMEIGVEEGEHVLITSEAGKTVFFRPGIPGNTCRCCFHCLRTVC